MLDPQAIDRLKRLKKCGERSTFLELLEHFSDDLIAAAEEQVAEQQRQAALLKAIRDTEDA